MKGRKTLMLEKIKSLFTPKKDEPMAATATGTQRQTTPGKTCSMPGSVEQLSATSECSGATTLCENAVRERAYLLWEKAGYPTSDGVDFWLQAEQELQAESDE